MIGIVKRDTIEDIGNSIVNSVKDVVGMDEDRGIIEDMKIEVIYLSVFILKKYIQIFTRINKNFNSVKKHNMHQLEA